MSVELADATRDGVAPPLVGARVDHVGLSTGDYDGTLRFYRDALGFELRREWTVESLPGMRLAYLVLNDFRLEVIASDEPFQDKLTPGDLGDSLRDRGFIHLSLRVADVDACARALRGRGVEPIAEPEDYDGAGIRACFVRDNNGYVIELLTPR